MRFKPAHKIIFSRGRARFPRIKLGILWIFFLCVFAGEKDCFSQRRKDAKERVNFYLAAGIRARPRLKN
jgi:hypothetical protein